MNSRRRKLPHSLPEHAQKSGTVQVVGIGASAGGLDAFRRFFNAMPADSGLAFVLIQHLHPEHESHVAQLVSKSTSMRVREAEDKVAVEPKCVYVIPPNRSLSIKGGRLHLSLPAQKRGMRTPIDHFLTSLADALGEKAVCLILSSSGTDGILGVRAIKAAGGMCMVQDPATAEYGDLPRSAITTGLVDYVLPVEKMPQTLLNYLSHSYMQGYPARATKTDPEPVLAKIQDLLRSRTTHDFRFFKRGTLLRRIERRMGLNQVQRIGDYVALLRKKPAEVTQLAKDLMIGVTQFFRDSEAFDELKMRIIPSLVRHRQGDQPIRVWVPGCATGEEAYSLIIILLEELALSGRTNKVQVFATDIDEDALQFARISHYPESIAADVSPQRLKRFFTPTEHGFMVHKTLRECVVFASQNLITAPPFSKIDIISCRNLAIYLEPVIQRRLVELFHFSLNPGGCLFLGSSEGIANREDLFRPVSKKWRIYRRMGGGRRELGAFPILSPDRISPPAIEATLRQGPAVNLSDLNQRLMTDHLSAASVLVDRKGRILFLAGRTDLYLELPHGEPSLELHAVAREGLRARLRAAVQAAFRDEKKVVLERESVRLDGDYVPVRVTITPVKSPPAAEGYLHIIFENVPDAVLPAGPPASGADEEKDGALRHLENELKSTRDDLQNTIEELETSNEELKVANEEALSSNEELQSAVEELETSKEELQSLNEELTTLNNQLQEKVQELTETTNDLANLLSSTEIATVFLDTKFRVKRFTSPVAKLLNLIPTDVGRPIRHIVQNLVDVDILEDAQAVVRKLVPVQRQVMSRSGSWYVMRVLPYRTTENVIEGVVITFADVSELAAKEAQLTERARRQRIVVDLGQKALSGIPTSSLIASAVRRVQEVLRADLSDVLMLDPSRDRFTMVAGAGWSKAKLGSRVPASGLGSPAVALRTRSTVFMDAVPSPHRPKPSSLQRADKVTSGMYALVGTQDSHIGLLGAHSRRKRTFAPEDGLFLQDIAQVLANAINHEKAELELRAMGRILEDRVRERTLWLTASQEVSRAANQTGSVRDVMQKALEAICTGTGWQFGHVFLASNDDPKVPVFQYSYYPATAAKFRPFERLTRKSNLGHAGALPSMTLRKGRAFWMAPPQAPEIPGSAAATSSGGWTFTRQFDRLKAPRMTLARRLGIQSAAAIPLKVGSSTVGMFEVFSDRPIPPSRPLLDMMLQVATEIGRSVERMQSQERFASALWREQRKIAQELHDSVGQELTGLGAMSESLLNEVNRKGHVAATRLKSLTTGLRGTLEKLRTVISGLFPMDVPPGEFMNGLAKLARQTLTRHGIRCKISGGLPGDPPGVEVTTHLFRIIQEAVANAVRHSKASRIDIGVQRNRQDLVLTIRDDGRGVDRARASSDGVGLRIMRHRSEAIGGRLIVKSSRRSGTTVTCTMPLDGDAASAPRR